jgi:hypothetical protein
MPQLLEMLQMKSNTQFFSVLAATTVASGLSSALVGILASNLFGVCDPKFGCTFGIQFMAALCFAAGILLGILLICGFAGYTAIAKLVIAPILTIKIGALAGMLLGLAWSMSVLAGYR